jgi:hypothetical protein
VLVAEQIIPKERKEWLSFARKKKRCVEEEKLQLGKDLPFRHKLHQSIALHPQHKGILVHSRHSFHSHTDLETSSAHSTKKKKKMK